MKALHAHFALFCALALSVGIAVADINVKNPPYNAAGNGQTDDAPAIQAALIDAAVRGGDTVVIPAGTYQINTVLIIGSNTRVVGAGKGATIVRGISGFTPGATVNGHEGNAILSMVASNNSSVEGLTVDNATNGTRNNGISMTPDGPNYNGAVCTNCTVRDCTVLGANFHQYLIWNLRGQGIRILNNYINGGILAYDSSSQQEGIECYGGSDVLIQGNRITSVGNSGIDVIAISGGPSSVDVSGTRVTDNHVSNCSQGIIALTTGGSISHLHIKDNVIVKPWTFGIAWQTGSSLLGLFDFQISGNSVVNAQYGIFLVGKSDTTATSSISVSRNAIENTSAPGLFGMVLRGLRGAIVEGNSVRNASNNSIWCYDSADMKLVNNTLEGAGQNGLYLGLCSRVTVQSNSLRNYNQARGGTSGIFADTTTQSSIRNNDFLTTNDVRAVIVNGACDSVRVTQNTMLYASAVTTTYMNIGTNANIGSVTLGRNNSRTVILNRLASDTARYVINQIAGKPLSFRVSYTPGGFELNTSSNPVGNEVFVFEIVE